MVVFSPQTNSELFLQCHVALPPSHTVLPLLTQYSPSCNFFSCVIKLSFCSVKAVCSLCFRRCNTTENSNSRNFIFTYHRFSLSETCLYQKGTDTLRKTPKPQNVCQFPHNKCTVSVSLLSLSPIHPSFSLIRVLTEG
jgi:hypothetical protein